VSFTNDTKPALTPPDDAHNQFTYQIPSPPTSKPLDLDGMTIMSGLEDDTPAVPDSNMGMELDLQPVAEGPGEETEDLPWGNDPATATWAPMMAEVNTSPIITYLY
jgi:hypothetical protein